jgi:hypothetical protein
MFSFIQQIAGISCEARSWKAFVPDCESRITVMSFMKPPRRIVLRSSSLGALCIAAILLFAGCSTPFTYTPKHAQQYSAISNDRGLAIVEGLDARVKKEKRPKWKPTAEQVVANALADELNHARLFQRVNVNLKHTVAQTAPEYSLAVSFRVKKLQLFNDYTAGEVAGGAALGLLGLPGVFIAASIPTKFVSDAEVEFEVFDVATKELVFAKNYSETRACTQNAYKGQKPLMEQTSGALEAVIVRFVNDLTALPVCGRVAVQTGTDATQ